MKKPKYTRQLEIIDKLKVEGRPLTLSEMAANYPDMHYHTIAAMLSRMAKDGKIFRYPYGGYVYIEKRLADDLKHKAVVKFMNSDKTALDISELYDAGFIAGRSV